MADEPTTQQDSTNSETTATDVVDATVETTEQQTATDATTDGEAADKTDGETSVLGGDVADKADGATEEVAGPPEKYELALEGVTLDPDALAAADPIFRELNLSNDQANKLMPVAKDFADRTAQATLQQIVEAGAAQKAEWLAAFKADPEIGGAKTDETTHLAAKALDALGFPEGHDFRKVLTETGFGNHPDMIRAMRKIGEMVGEDGFVRPDAGAPPAKKDAAEILYGKTGAN